MIVSFSFRFDMGSVCFMCCGSFSSCLPLCVIQINLMSKQQRKSGGGRVDEKNGLVVAGGEHQVDALLLAKGVQDYRWDGECVKIKSSHGYEASFKLDHGRLNISPGASDGARRMFGEWKKALEQAPLAPFCAEVVVPAVGTFTWASNMSSLEIKTESRHNGLVPWIQSVGLQVGGNTVKVLQ